MAYLITPDRRPLRRRVLGDLHAGLPGTTVDTTPLPPRVEGQWGESVPEDAEWAGATTLGTMTLAGQHLIAPGGTGLTARKTWLLLEDRIVALGSDIRTGTRAETKTVLEHRNLGARPGRLLVDGEAIGADPVEVDGATWAHLEGTGGYVLLEDTRLRAVQDERAGSWSRNHASGSEETLRRHYATLEAVHPGEGSSYATCRCRAGRRRPAPPRPRRRSSATTTSHGGPCGSGARSELLGRGTGVDVRRGDPPAMMQDVGRA